MAKTIRFYVKNDLPTATTNHVLVFLKPVDAKADYQYAAWKDLNPSQGSTQPFDFAIDIAADVIDPQTGSISARKSINPGQCFPAVNPNGQSPYIDTSTSLGGVTASQAAIKNQCTTPVTNIGIDWYNLGSKVVTVGTAATDIINVGKTVTFELQPALYFMAADPTTTGPNYTLQTYSEATPYHLDVSTTEVYVRWYRDSGSSEDKFEFTPPSRSFMQTMNVRATVSSQFEEGYYTNVLVSSPTHAPGYLSGGTGTMSSFNMFSCGKFEADSLPVVGEIYTITATDKNGAIYTEPMKCTHSGPTSDFQPI